jgi:hypothetical protein
VPEAGIGQGAFCLVAYAKASWHRAEVYWHNWQILSFLHSRLGSQWDEKDLRRATDALFRRGHSYQEIRNALQEFSQDTELQEDIYG